MAGLRTKLKFLFSRLIFYDDTTSTVKGWSQKVPQSERMREELKLIQDLKIKTQNYSFHPSCNCSRRASNIEDLQSRFLNHKTFWDKKLEESPLNVPGGVYVGRSTCNDYTSVLGSGQMVLSYSYYTPWSKPHRQ